MNTFLRNFWNQNPVHNLQVMYAVFCAVVAPIFSFLIFDIDAQYNNFYINILLPIFFLIIAFLGVRSENRAFFFYVFTFFLLLVTAYCFIIVHFSNYDLQNTLAFVLVFTGISIAINKWYFSLFYHVLVILTFIVGISFSDHVIIDPLQVIGFLIVTSIIAIAVLYPMSKILSKQIEFNTYLENIIDEGSHGVIIINQHTKTILRSNSFVNHLFDSSRVLYKDLIPIFSKIQKNQDIIKLEHELEGKIFEIEIKKTNNLGPDVTHIVNLFDISEIKKRKKELMRINDKYAASKETYESLFESASEFILIMDDSFSIINANLSFVNKFQLSKEEVEGSSLEELYQLTDDQTLTIKSSLVQLNSDGNGHYRFKTKIELDQEEFYLDTFIKKGKFYGDNIFILTSRDITLQEHNRKVIQTSRDHLAKLLESIDYVVYNLEINKEFKQIRYLSPKTEEIFGISVDEYITQYKVGKIKEYYHPDDYAQVATIKEEDLSKSKSPKIFQYRFYNKKKDKYIWIEEKIFPRIEKGQHVANFGIASDISKRVEYEEKIKKSERKYKSIYENNSAAIFYAKRGLMIDANKACARLMGYESVEDFIGQPIAKHHLNEEKRKSFLEELLTKKKIRNKEIPFVKKNGELIWTLFNAKSSEKDAFGDDVFECTFLDITELRKTTLALKESDNKYKTLFTEARDTILLLDEDFRIVEANDWTAEMFAIEMKDLLGKNISDFAKDTFHETSLLNELNLIKKEEANYFEWEFKSIEDDLIFAEVSAVMVQNNNQSMIQMIIRDMTKWIEKERIIDQSRQSFKNITDYTPEAILIKVDESILYANNNAINLLESNEEDIFSIAFYALFNKKAQSILQEQEQKLVHHSEEVSNYIETEIKVNEKTKKVGVRMMKTNFLGQIATYIFINDLSTRIQLEKEKLRAEIAENINRQLEKEIENRIAKENRIKELERYTRSIINSSIDTIIVTDQKGNILEANDAIQKTFRYQLNEIKGNNISLLFKSKEEFQNLRKYILKNKSYIGEFEALTKKNKNFPAFISVSPLIEDDGKITGNVSIIRDTSEIKDTQHKLDIQNSKMKAIFESASNSFLWTVDKDLNLSSFNPKFEELLLKTNGVQVEVGMSMKKIARKVLPENQVEILFNAFKKVLNNQEESFEGYVYDTKNNGKFWLESYISPITLPNSNEVIQIACISHDVNDKMDAIKKIKDSLKEKEVLLKEVHHRVKNNLQVISSILNLQSSYVKDDNTLNILKESQDRIKSMSFIHENLYQTKNFSSIKFSDYIVNISKNLVHSYQIFDTFVEIEYEFDEVDLNLDQAIPCGLIVNELISNALKHAFDENGGTIMISVKNNDNIISLCIEDDGKGIAEDFDVQNTDSLGLQLVHTLVDQLDGEIQLFRENGTKYLITFEKQN